MIASGKSTYARNAAAVGCVVINDDAIVAAVHGGNYGLYAESLKPLYKTTENHLLTTAVAMGKSVVVDRGLNVNRQSRQRFLALSRALDCPVVAVVFNREEPAVHARRRADSDGRGYDFNYWLRVATAHNERWDTPTLTEGFRSIEYPSWRLIEEGWCYSG